MVKLVPVPNEAPPDAALYQFKVPPAHPLAANVTVPVPHLEAPVPVGDAGTGFTVKVLAHVL